MLVALCNHLLRQVRAESLGLRREDGLTVMSLSGLESERGRMTIGLVFISEEQFCTHLLNDTIVRGTVPGI